MQMRFLGSTDRHKGCVAATNSELHLSTIRRRSYVKDNIRRALQVRLSPRGSHCLCYAAADVGFAAVGKASLSVGLDKLFGYPSCARVSRIDLRAALVYNHTANSPLGMRRWHLLRGQALVCMKHLSFLQTLFATGGKAGRQQ